MDVCHLALPQIISGFGGLQSDGLKLHARVDNGVCVRVWVCMHCVSMRMRVICVC
jgi:hypothetical protein